MGDDRLFRGKTAAKFVNFKREISRRKLFIEILKQQGYTSSKQRDSFCISWNGSKEKPYRPVSVPWWKDCYQFVK